MEQIIDWKTIWRWWKKSRQKRPKILLALRTPTGFPWAWSLQISRFTQFYVSPKIAARFWVQPGFSRLDPKKENRSEKTTTGVGTDPILSPKQKQTLVSSQNHGEILTSNQAAVEFIPNNGISYRQLKSKKTRNLYLHLTGWSVSKSCQLRRRKLEQITQPEKKN